jgi:propanol-preferring alcohol dehydrogenase
MLAARFKEPGKDFSIEEINLPTIGSDDVLVEIKAAGICGSDVHYRKGHFAPRKIPLTLGHEGSGVVKDKGENVSNIRIGDHVVVHYVISCGNCLPCLQGFDNRCRNRKSIGADVDGTFAEFITVPSRSVLKMPYHVPFEWGAISACAISTAFHAIKKADIKKSDTVVIFGTGGVGVHTVMWAKFFGAGKVIAIDLVESKLETARAYGADITVNPTYKDVLDAIMKETDGWGADVAVECSGSAKAIKQAFRVIKGKNRFESGTVVSVGLQTEPFQVKYWNLREGWLSVSGDHTRHELYQIIKLMANKRINLSKSITHCIPLQDINKGVDQIENRKEHVIRVIVDMEKTKQLL